VFLLALIFSFLKEFLQDQSFATSKEKKNTHIKQLADIKQHFFFEFRERFQHMERGKHATILRNTTVLGWNDYVV